MRTSINLEQDVHDFASSYAAAHGVSLSAAVNCLLHRAERLLHEGDPTAGLKMTSYGYYVFPATGVPVTPEMVKELSEDPVG